MKFIADLHIHSRFSMATSRSLSLRELSRWAARKGITVLGTGDFTHPGWRKELKEQLESADDTGLYQLKTGFSPTGGVVSPGPLFCLQTEISCIYKAGGATRKIHNLVFMPDMDAADKFSSRLATLGNISADGRPTLALSSRDLLETALETSERAVLVPAHIWTPWFGLFGSKSGFDCLEDCYADLSGHIFALETGLSSDPPMNRLLSRLDNFALISNSDAHSGMNLGREANLFSGQPDYGHMFNALRSQAKRMSADSATSFLGTLEFYPQEGKYHLDGHRACNISLTPAESRHLGNICPVCGKPLTIGVLHRVTDLADRDAPPPLPLEPPKRMLVPLPEIIAQIMGRRSQAKSVAERCASAARELGPELEMLCFRPIEEISEWWEPLGEAIRRIRRGQVAVEAGYDGKYGKIEIFEPGEL